ncbi:hypothetical protein SLS53_001997 [Cytospora paraplurivora]|uniref:Carboxylic ester hydrolase n=1 Tax=Cytospora paraplurivora TaxID=2898453 RepID=A0AAN9YL73_9PEZI
MKGIISLAYRLGLLHSSVVAASTPTVLDHTTNVTYKGIHRNGVDVFLNIPYGQDTGGEHRFKPPRPYVPARGSTIVAQSCGPACPQQLGNGLGAPISLSSINNVSEDCLSLNVARPSGAKPGDKLPVLLWIHGGAFWVGQNCEITTAPEGMILESLDNDLPIIHVRINYRLGFFGFTRSDYLKSEGSENAGLRDQRLAIEWVRDNIEHFGGDPNRITISGQSSGGLAVGMQILAYGGTRPVPFQQAICQSQAIEPGLTGNFTTDALQLVVDYVGCNDTDLESRETVECMRSLDMDTLLNATLETYNDGYDHNIGDIWLPVVDGDFIPEAPSKLISEGRFANVTAMIGWDDNDLTIFTDPAVRTANDSYNFVQTYIPGFTTENVEDLLALYPVTDFAANETANLTAEFYRSARIFRDILMTCQPIWYGEHLAARGNDVYLYNWNQTLLDPIMTWMGYPGLGPMHTSEFAYIFGNISHYNTDDFPFNPDPSDWALQSRGSKSWSTFVATGVPSLEKHDTFQGFTPAFEQKNETKIYVVGGPHEGLSPIDGPNAEPALAAEKLRSRCGFLNSPEIIAALMN